MVSLTLKTALGSIPQGSETMAEDCNYRRAEEGWGYPGT